MMPNVNTATARVFDALGIQILIAPDAGGCGAIRLHLGFNDDALDDVRNNIDAWWPYVENGVEAIVMNASGCGATVKEYAHLMRNDPDYAQKAARIVDLTRDLAEILPLYEDELTAMARRRAVHTVAYHPPCTLQHALRVKGVVEALLHDAGFTLTEVSDGQRCCGSAGTYSVLQPQLAGQLLRAKVAALEAGGPDVIATANIGCLVHIASATAVPVRHWVELLAARLADG